MSEFEKGTEKDYDYDLVIAQSYIIGLNPRGQKEWVLFAKHCRFFRNLIALSDSEILQFINNNFNKKKICQKGKI